MALACYDCGKIIKGMAVHIVPSNLAISLGKDFPRAYHPACYKRAETTAGRQLRKRR